MACSFWATPTYAVPVAPVYTSIQGDNDKIAAGLGAERRGKVSAGNVFAVDDRMADRCSG